MNATELRSQVRQVLDAHWRSDGYTVPNAVVYPFQWLWDSCFHAVLWAELGEGDRAVAELRHLFRNQEASGFVPHVDYAADPRHHASFWGRDRASTITQPPMYGWALAALAERGVAPPDDLCDAARRGLGFLLEHRHREPATGLVTVVHPWETGCDDSPRWDHWGAARADRWYEAKGRLLASVTRDREGAPIANPDLGVAPAGFNALVAFNARELAGALGDAALRAQADELATALGGLWDGDLRTWRDAAPPAVTSSRVRTADALLPLLVVDDDRGAAAAGELADAAAFAGRHGPRGVHREEPSYEPRRYWRGGAWAPLAYLLWRALRDRGDSRAAAALAHATTAGARRSGLSEWWDADTGRAGGAAPQSWSGLCLLMEER